jgi:hypothetical protein
MSGEANEIIQKMDQSMIIDHMNSLMGSLLPICFDMCIKTPGTKLCNQEQDCLSRCSEYFTESMAITSSVFLKKIKKAN